GLTVQLSADAGVSTVGATTNVWKWADQQTADNSHASDVFQGTSSATTLLQPKLIANQLNGLPVVRFDGDTNGGGGNADWMQSTDDMTNMITRPKWTIFTVFKATAILRTNPSASFVSDAVYGDSNGYMGLHLKKTTSPASDQLYAYNFGTSDNIAPVAA